MHSFTRVLVVLSVFALACGGDDGGSGGDPDATAAETVSIQDVQGEDMAVGTAVRVEDVVVTAIDTFGGRVGAIYVQEPEGGERSGVVLNTSSVPSGVVVGSIVSVQGFKDEFALNADMTGRTVTQIGSPQVTVTGSGDVPAAEVVDPRTLGDDAEAEKWEGVLITLENVRFEGLPRGVTDTDDTLEEGRLTGPFRVQSALAGFPGPIAYRDCYSSITGIGDYFFDYKVLPRSAADFVASANDADCPAEETACDNTTDDDADGFTDCADFACYAADAEVETAVCSADNSVIEIQDDTVLDDATVRTTAVVTAVGRDRDEVWVQTLASAGADHDGLHVQAFRSVLVNDEIDPAIVIGSDVVVVGIKRNSFDETVVGNATVVVDGGTSVPLARADAVLGDMGSVTTGKPYEGQLVTFTAAPVSAVGMFGQFTLDLDGAGGAAGLLVDDSLFSYTQPAVGECVTITGVVLLNTFDDFYYLAPRLDADLAVVTCL